MSVKYEVHIGTFRLSAALSLNLKILWGGLPSAVSVASMWAVTCALYNGKIWVNVAEPWTSVIFSHWKIKTCPWKVLEFWFDKAVRTLWVGLKVEIVYALILTKQQSLHWKLLPWKDIFLWEMCFRHSNIFYFWDEECIILQLNS